ncbi:hypothetical protein NDU88_001143 [Pleurodeles waltl]|uniref:Secreted protein n=1 Tax=Pleurodeles waltl TaxID=8319 RepID=A0AAV7P7W2_PLEWA|nr:hypothetical protein NDU88_001143 [Pleurodeles waltl]
MGGPAGASLCGRRSCRCCSVLIATVQQLISSRGQNMRLPARDMGPNIQMTRHQSLLLALRPVCALWEEAASTHPECFRT